MKLITTAAAALAGSLAIFGSCGAALAVTNNGGSPGTAYVAAFAPVFGISGVPRSGTMMLQVTDGSISGQYTGTSIGPDPLDNRTVPVIGTVSGNERYVQLYIGMGLTLRGTMAADGTISGTASDDGRLYDFVAAPHLR